MMYKKYLPSHGDGARSSDVRFLEATSLHVCKREEVGLATSARNFEVEESNLVIVVVERKSNLTGSSLQNLACVL